MIKHSSFINACFFVGLFFVFFSFFFSFCFLRVTNEGSFQLLDYRREQHTWQAQAPNLAVCSNCVSCGGQASKCLINGKTPPQGHAF